MNAADRARESLQIDAARFHRSGRRADRTRNTSRPGRSARVSRRLQALFERMDRESDAALERWYESRLGDAVPWHDREVSE